jgi:hypothetical protein
MSRQYTNEEQDRMDKRAEDAARKEWENDINRKDPAGVQDRIEAKLKEYRQSIGLER